MASRALLVVALCALAACAPGPPKGQRQRAIVNGVPDGGHPEVGVLHIDGVPCCTATLVGARTAITAAHCLTEDEEAPYALAQTVELELGGAKRPAAEWVIHPDYSGWSLAGDLGVVRLGKPVPDLTPAIAAEGPPTLDEAITLVGFGCTGEDPASFGVKRKGENEIAKLKPTELGYAIGGAVSSLCEGDSGGPSFAVREGVELLVGVHSYDLGPYSYDQRVDVYRGWLEEKAQGDLYQAPPLKDAGPPLQIVAVLDRVAVDARVPVDGAALEAEPTVEPTGGCSVAPGSAFPLWSSLLVLVLGCWSTRRRGAAVTILLLLLGGCHTLLGFGASGRDAAVDRSGFDRPHSRERALVDGPRGPEARPRDALVEVTGTADRGAVDVFKLPVPEGGVVRCAPGVAYQVAQIGTGASEIAICQGPPRNQCTAEDLCNTAANWTLCGGKYQKVVGADPIPSNAENAWLKICVRELSAIFPPGSFVCSGCASIPVNPPLILSWGCSDSTVGSCDNQYCAARTSPTCFKIGEDSMTNAGMWRAANASALSNRAVCCK